MTEIFGIIHIEYDYDDLDFYDTNFLDKNGTFQFILHGRVYSQNHTSKTSHHRINYLYTCGEKYDHVGVLSINEVNHSLTTDQYGHFYLQLQVVQKPTNKEQTIYDQVKQKYHHFYLNIISPNGYAIISDIDDTIKHSDVLNKIGLILNTFYRQYTPNTNVQTKFTELAKHYQINNYHYVSSSPWQLYPSLHDFICQFYPTGTLYLKLLDLDKVNTIMKFIVSDTVGYKLPIISAIINSNPSQKYFLIGDSGEKDPEIYNLVYNQYPNQIEMIIINDILHDPDQVKSRLDNIPDQKIQII